MPLPRLSVQEYELLLPVSQQKVTFRPYKVKEQKMLLMAAESNDSTEQLKALRNLINACVTNNDEFDAFDLPTADFEFLYLNIRMKSVGETTEPIMTLQTQEDEEPFNVQIKVDLSEVKVNTENLPDRKIKLTDDLIVEMSWPSYNMITEIQSNNESSKSLMSIHTAVLCIERIHDATQTFTRGKDFTTEEASEFVESLDAKSFEKLLEFIGEVPRLSHEVKYIHPKTKQEETLMLEGISDFFG